MLAYPGVSEPYKMYWEAEQDFAPTSEIPGAPGQVFQSLCFKSPIAQHRWAWKISITNSPSILL